MAIGQTICPPTVYPPPNCGEPTGLLTGRSHMVAPGLLALFVEREDAAILQGFPFWPLRLDDAHGQHKPRLQSR
eukprot:1509152-Lingulodinium_polyedra.AAC.1